MQTQTLFPAMKLLLILVMSLALAGCVPIPPPSTTEVVAPAPLPTSPSASSSASPTEPSTGPSMTLTPTTPDISSDPIHQALRYAPLNTQLFSFTDWAMIKAVAGAEDVTSASSMDERMAFLRPLALTEQALASAFGLNYFVRHAETWGWDLTDLLWESSLNLDGPPIFVLRFRDDFDFAPVLALLDERGYQQSEYGPSQTIEATIYSHELDLTVDWFPSTEFAIFNLAYLPAEKMFILSSSPDSVLATLDAVARDETLHMRPDVTAVAAELGQVGTAILAPFGCQATDIMPNLALLGDTPEEIIEALQQPDIVGLYTVFGLGYRVDEVEGEALPLGVFVLHYLSTEQAEADVDPRRRLAETADSLTRQVPYAELFRVIDLAVVPSQGELGELGAANLVLRLHAIERSPQFFFNLFYSRDLLFAVCGGM